MPATFSCVSFLNALPFVEGLRRLPRPSRPRLLLDPPYRCAERLREGGVDAALVPSIEFARLRGAAEAGGFGISSRHEVRSVILLSRRPLAGIREVAVDENSRTSVALLGVLLSRCHGVRPRMTPMPPDPAAMLARCEAALLIGDAALRAPRSGLETWDLASMWHRFTGWPFVFALWAARDGETAARVAPILGQALERGFEVLPQAAAAAAAEVGLRPEEVLDYLTRNIHFRIGDEERRSMERFLTLCREEGILSEPTVGSRAI